MKHFLLSLIAAAAFASTSDDLRMGCEAIAANTAMDKADKQTQYQMQFALGFIVGGKHAYQNAYLQRTGKSLHDGYVSVGKLCRISLNAYRKNDEAVEFIHVLSAVVAKDLSVSNRTDIVAP